ASTPVPPPTCHWKPPSPTAPSSSAKPKSAAASIASSPFACGRVRSAPCPPRRRQVPGLRRGQRPPHHQRAEEALRQASRPPGGERYRRPHEDGSEGRGRQPLQRYRSEEH